MFRDQTQLARTCRALTDRILSREGPFWTDEGPTRAAIRHREDSPMAPSARALLGAAWALWCDSTEGPTFGELLLRLDGPNLRAVGNLLLALCGSAEDLDAWLAEQAGESEAA